MDGANQGTWIKDPWAWTMGWGLTVGGKWVRAEQRGEMGQLELNNTKIKMLLKRESLQMHRNIIFQLIFFTP